MTTAINLTVQLEHTAANDVACIISNVVKTYIPSIANDMMQPETAGFKSITINFNPITRHYDASIYYLLSNRMIVHTSSSPCPVSAVANLMMAMAIMEPQIKKIRFADSGDVQINYTVDDDDDCDEDDDTDYPF